MAVPNKEQMICFQIYLNYCGHNFKLSCTPTHIHTHMHSQTKYTVETNSPLIFPMNMSLRLRTPSAPSGPR